MFVSRNYHMSFIGARSDGRNLRVGLLSKMSTIKLETYPNPAVGSNGKPTFVSIHIELLKSCDANARDSYYGYGLVEFDVSVTFKGSYNEGVMKVLDRAPVVILRHANRFLRSHNITAYQIFYKGGAKSQALTQKLHTHAARVIEDKYIAWACRPGAGSWYSRAYKSHVEGGMCGRSLRLVSMSRPTDLVYYQFYPDTLCRI